MADELEDARRIVAKVSDETRVEREAEARRVLAWLDKADPGVRVKFMTYTIQRQRDDAAALNYAETRLSEMRAQLEALADEFTKPFGPDASKWPAGFAAAYAAAGEAIRAVARG